MLSETKRMLSGLFERLCSCNILETIPTSSVYLTYTEPTMTRTFIWCSNTWVCLANSDEYRCLPTRCLLLLFALLDTDLHNVIKRGNILKEVHKQYIMYQLLRATKYLHSGNVIHRDQKVSSTKFVKHKTIGI
jgi:serine/threonine protein kinase